MAGIVLVVIILYLIGLIIGRGFRAGSSTPANKIPSEKITTKSTFTLIAVLIGAVLLIPALIVLSGLLPF